MLLLLQIGLVSIKYIPLSVAVVFILWGLSYYIFSSKTFVVDTVNTSLILIFFILILISLIPKNFHSSFFSLYYYCLPLIVVLFGASPPVSFQRSLKYCFCLFVIFEFIMTNAGFNPYVFTEFSLDLILERSNFNFYHRALGPALNSSVSGNIAVLIFLEAILLEKNRDMKLIWISGISFLLCSSGSATISLIAGYLLFALVGGKIFDLRQYIWFFLVILVIMPIAVYAFGFKFSAEYVIRLIDSKTFDFSEVGLPLLPNLDPPIIVGGDFLIFNFIKILGFLLFLVYCLIFIRTLGVNFFLVAFIGSLHYGVLFDLIFCFLFVGSNHVRYRHRD